MDPEDEAPLYACGPVVEGRPQKYFGSEKGCPMSEEPTSLPSAAITLPLACRGNAACATPATVGAVKLIDPTARGCETDALLALANRVDDEIEPRPVAAPAMPMAVPPAEMRELVASARRKAVDAGLRPEDLQLPVQPPLEHLTGKACVVYSLG